MTAMVRLFAKRTGPGRGEVREKCGVMDSHPQLDDAKHVRRAIHKLLDYMNRNGIEFEDGDVITIETGIPL